MDVVWFGLSEQSPGTTCVGFHSDYGASFVEAAISSNQGTGLRDAGVGSRIDPLLFDSPPEALNEDIRPARRPFRPC